jgi:hypothetical protein
VPPRKTPPRTNNIIPSAATAKTRSKGGVFRGQKNSDGGDVARLADAAERGLRDGDLLEVRSDEAAAVGAFSLDHAGTDGVDPDLLRAELAGQHDGDGIDRGLGAGVNRAVLKSNATGNGGAGPLHIVKGHVFHQRRGVQTLDESGADLPVFAAGF